MNVIKKAGAGTQLRTAPAGLEKYLAVSCLVPARLLEYLYQRP